MFKRDPRDPRRRERLAGSTLASLVMHAILAVLLISLAASSAQEQGASEVVQGGSLVILEQRAPAVAHVPAPAQPAAPVPNAPQIAPVIKHAPVVVAAARPQPPVRHELSKFAPTAPPNPTPIPQASAQPNPQPTEPVYDVKPQNELPTVPSAAPSAINVQVAIKTPPTVAPTPAPTIAPTATPVPRTPEPHTPQPSAPPTVAPTIAPTLAPTAAPTRAPSAAPTHAPTAAPTQAPTAAPSAVAVATNAGIPSPSPTQGPKISENRGVAPTPGPRGASSPGPRPGNGAAKSGRNAPIQVRATPKPASGGGSGSSVGGGIRNDLGNLLAGMIPHNNVNIQNTQHAYNVAVGGAMEPTPPPEILAQTKFMYQEKGAGSDALTKMWVTGTHREGPLLICDGWLVRYPAAGQPGFMHGTMTNPTSGGIAMGIPLGGSGGTPAHGAPIVEGMSHVSCQARGLVPIVPGSPSP
jgi:hypothetical protein